MTPGFRRAGAQGLLLQVAEDAVLDWNSWLRDARDKGALDVVDIVPGAQTVLLAGLADPAATEALLADVDPPRAPVQSAASVEIPVVWDGPDLGDVAAHWSMSECDVGDLLTGCRLRVAFGGFAPGFGYLSGLPADRTVPRRSSPRTSVPAGSVGLAGPYVGIYPRSSPGGWQLVGHTDAELFDADRDPPALLSPGVVVRLVTA